ncbi:Replication protein A 70 kDa DNA-binding subunit [Thelohanellus kitauei]|uniref:Replication protein A subunit n=1 Tax=Thelohanellus kitauei TaxID=669202 RepID=A0A0C2MMV5_THEKT|nr:Replication protein A 70 kDa DNA-binding subunit [Thelohanellus kitauei]
MTRWTIRAFVDSKSNVITYANNKGEGNYFHVLLVDDSVFCDDNQGEIIAKGWNKCVELFYDTLTPKKLYFISGGTLKEVSSPHLNFGNRYELSLNQRTVIKTCFEKIPYPKIKYNFVAIEKILEIPKNTSIDIIGIITEIGDLQTIYSKKLSKHVLKRDIKIVDDSEYTVILSLWNEKATATSDIKLNSGVALKGAQMSDFRGFSLSTVSTTVIQLDPDIPEIKRLVSWFKNTPPDTEYIDLSACGLGFEIPFITLNEISSFQSMSHYKTKYVQIIGMVHSFRTKNPLYKSCPTPICHKKVVEYGPNNYRCEKCNRNFNNYLPRFMMNGKIVDATTAHYVTFFSEQVEKMVGITAQEVDRAQNGPLILGEITNRLRFKRYVFKLRLKPESCNDHTRIRSTCVSMRPINFVTEGRILLEKIKKLDSIS